MQKIRILAGCAALLIACAAPAMGKTFGDKNGFSVSPLAFNKIHGWNEDNHGEALEAFRRSCTKLQTLSANAAVGEGLLGGTAADWERPCIEAQSVDTQDFVGSRSFFEREFTPYRLAFNGVATGKMTGYYEPLMRGAWKRNSAYTEPVYGKPEDLVSSEIYPLTRAQIDGGALAGKGLERMYIDNPVDVFFLHVQGSGRVLMDTGEMVALRYEAKTNQPYTAIGRVLVDRGELTREEVSAPAIRRWLRENPQQMREVMHHNDSFVFFHVAPDVSQGPVGAQNVPLIPERSLAVDAAYIPLGMPLWLSSTLPRSAHGSGTRYDRLMVAQDKGSAITGAIRGDVFFGYGERAEDLAGHMNSDGEFIALVPNQLARKVEGKRF